MGIYIYHGIRCLLEVLKEVAVMKYIIGYRAGVRARARGMRVLAASIFGALALFSSIRFIPENMMSIVYVPVVIISFCILTEKTNVPRLLLSLISYVCICEIYS